MRNWNLLLFLLLVSSVDAFAGRVVPVKNGSAVPLDGALQENEFALTFDDGPDPEITPKILEVLARHGVKATFFEVGERALAHPEITKAVLAAGHALGSHSWDHSDLTQMPEAEAEANIRRGHLAVEEAAGGGFHSSFFRFPYFYSNEALQAAVRGMGYSAFPANVVTEDWLAQTPAELLAKSLRFAQEQGHGIILFHDVQPPTPVMMDEFLTAMETRGARFVEFRAEP